MIFAAELKIKLYNNPIGTGIYFEHFEILRFLKNINKKIYFDSIRQCKQLQFEKPLGIKFDMPIHKRFAINLL